MPMLRTYAYSIRARLVALRCESHLSSKPPAVSTGGIEERGEEGCEREGEAGGEQGGDSGPPQASSGEDDAGESLPTSLKELLAARCAGRPRRRLRPG